MLKPRQDIADPYNPGRGYCAVDDCTRLQRNHGHKRWGKYCDKHHSDLVFVAKRRAARAIESGLLKDEVAARGIEYRRNRRVAKTFPRPCTKCSEVKGKVDYITVGSSQCRSCESKKSRNRRIKRTYGLNIDFFEAMRLGQNGVCAICGLRPKRGSHLVIDHCHNTGVVRGLLCGKCNTGLGQFDEDLDLLASAASYLINSKLKRA